MNIKRLVMLTCAVCLLVSAALGCSLVPSETDHSPGSQEMQITIE